MSRKKNLPANDIELRQRQDKFFDTFCDESDRGCVLVAVAILDECLEMLLRTQFIQSDPKFVNSLFVGQSPLSSFWSKIQLVKALDLVPAWMYKDLECIRALRNTFAHHYESADFNDKAVIVLTEKLKGADHAVDGIEKQKLKKSASPKEEHNNIPSSSNSEKRVFKKERVVG